MASSSCSPTSNFKLFTAASNGDLKGMKEVAKHMTEKFGEHTARGILGFKDVKGRTALHYAAAGGRTHVCKYLVETMKFDADLKDFGGYTPLQSAVSEGHYMTSSYLLDHGALPNMAAKDGLTALHCAAEKGRKDHLRLLITRGAEVDAPSYFKGTPLKCAAANGMKDAVKILLEHKANPNSDGHPIYTPLIVAIYAKSVDCVRLLLKSGADPNLGTHGDKPLFVAVKEEEIEIIKCLLKAGADPNATNFYDFTPIEVAAIEGKLAIVTLLFDVTARLPSIPNWSSQGIMDYVNSPEAKTQRELKAESKFLEAKENGAKAYKNKEYLPAIHWYTEAMKQKPRDATVYSNRSLCWACLNDGDKALRDAMSCISLRPDWSKAYYRAGVGYKLLKNSEKAAEAFKKGLDLDPNNKELQDAHREAQNMRASPRSDYSIGFNAMQ